MKRVGFLINPIAGMGGRVGLKGTDGVVDQAIRLGARPIADLKAAKAMRRLRTLFDRSADPPEVRWITCTGAMGSNCLNDAGFVEIHSVYESSAETHREEWPGFQTEWHSDQRQQSHGHDQQADE